MEVEQTSLPAEYNNRRIVIDVGAHETKISVFGGELKRESNGVLMLSETSESSLARPVAAGITHVWLSPYKWHEIVNPFANLDSAKKHLDAAVFFVAEMVRKYSPQEGLSRLLKPRIEVAVALPEWLMSETELVTRFYADVATKLKLYRVTFVNSHRSFEW